MELVLILFLIAGICLSINALCEKKDERKDERKASIILIIIIMCFLIKGLWSHMATDSNSKEDKCHVCYKTFTNKDDIHSIIMTNMCKNCYSNFK